VTPKQIAWSWRWVLGSLVHVLLACSSGDSSSNTSNKPWSCWLGVRRTTGGDTLCTCYQAVLVPWDGSPAIGTSCSQSLDTDFLCCVRDYPYGGGCTCFYEAIGTTGAAEYNDRNCGALADKVDSCPP